MTKKATMVVTRRAMLITLGSTVLAGSLTYGISRLRLWDELPSDGPAGEAYADQDGWVITVLDKERLAASTEVRVLENADLPGGDIANAVVEDSAACETWCLSNPECRSYTFTKPSHPDIEKRNMCWIKYASEPGSIESPFYTSGVRTGWRR